MPELPEVETIRMQLEKTIVGLVVEDIEVLREKSFVVPLRPASQTLRGVTRELRGMRVVGVRRRAKVISIDLGDRVRPCQLVLAIHLKMTGQLIFRAGERGSKRAGDDNPLRRPLAETPMSIGGKGDALARTNVYDTGELPNKYTRVIEKSKIKNQKSKSQIKIQKEGPYETNDLPNKYTRVIISFANGNKLYFNDLRVFGWIRVVRDFGGVGGSEGGEGKYGPEAVDEETFTLEYFRKMLGKTSRAVKLAILDQEKLAGVGNIYANEALFRAGIDPRKEAKRLRSEEIKTLREEIIKVLREAIEYGGTSDKDEAFRQIDGSKGGYQKYLQVYNREGKPCVRCGELIKKVKVGGRGTYYCSRCQR